MHSLFVYYIIRKGRRRTINRPIVCVGFLERGRSKGGVGMGVKGIRCKPLVRQYRARKCANTIDGRNDSTTSEHIHAFMPQAR